MRTISSATQKKVCEKLMARGFDSDESRMILSSRMQLPKVMPSCRAEISMA